MEGGNYIREGKDSHKSTCIIFSVQEELGALAKALSIFEVFIMHLNSRIHGVSALMS